MPNRTNKGSLTELADAPPAGNASKCYSYSAAWLRIKIARGSGFYLEAVTLEESIITDRLISFLCHAGELSADSPPGKHSLGQLIKAWMARVPEPIPIPFFPDLRVAINDWRIKRNEVVHGLVKSMPGTQHGELKEFLREAEFAAFQGEFLAHAISDWVKKAGKKRHDKGAQAVAMGH